MSEELSELENVLCVLQNNNFDLTNEESLELLYKWSTEVASLAYSKIYSSEIK